MKEKKFKKWLVCRALIIAAVFACAILILNLTTDKTFIEKSFNLANEIRYDDQEGFPDLQKPVCRMDRSDLVTITSIEQVNDDIIWIAEPIANNSGSVFITIENPDTGRVYDSAYLFVTGNGLIINTATGNFTNYRTYQVCVILFAVAVAILLWSGFVRSLHELRFSYQSIFCAGLGLWCVIIGITLIVQYYQDDIMLNFYSSLSGAPRGFMLMTFPLILAFSVLLTVSNISLIRHEGFRFANALGIMISAAMIIGAFFLWFFSDLVSSGSETEIKLWQTFVSLMETAYTLLECFLIGSMICGFIAARNKPAYDKDYIVILGCKIRKDGSLYPLIRGRVDRAIRFYREQAEITGKKAILIPSGGKGSDEIISEGEAMRRYLLEQGIAPEQIIPETNSVNTRQNMLFSMELIEKDKKAVFSTTNYHVFRSGIIAGQVGFEADGMGSSTKWYFWPNAYVREVIGMISYKWKSLILLFIPIVAFLTVIRFMF